MSHLDDTISRIPRMTAKERDSWRRKARDVLGKKPNHAEALRLLDALDVFEAGQPRPTGLGVTGLLAWEKYEKGSETPFRAFHGDRVVGRIVKRATHSGTRKHVYSVELSGRMLAGAWHHISDAREAGEAAYAARQGKAGT